MFRTADPGSYIVLCTSLYRPCLILLSQPQSYSTSPSLWGTSGASKDRTGQDPAGVVSPPSSPPVDIWGSSPSLCAKSVDGPLDAFSLFKAFGDLLSTVFSPPLFFVSYCYQSRFGEGKERCACDWPAKLSHNPLNWVFITYIIFSLVHTNTHEYVFKYKNWYRDYR